MSRETRKLKKRKTKRRNLILFLVAIIILLALGIGYYRSNQSMILNLEDYVKSVNGQVYLLKDTNYIKLDDFSKEDLAYPEGTKASGYDVLTKSAMVVNKEFLSSQIQDINRIISNNTFTNWDQYSLDLRDVLGKSSLLGGNDDISFYENTAEYSPDNQEELQNEVQLLTGLNTGNPVQITLGTFNITDTGFIYSTISEYDRIANEAVLGALNTEMINDISKLDTSTSDGLRVVNNDHCYAVTEVSEDTLVQGEEQTTKLRQQFGQGLTNSDYYNMLIDRVDRVREFPQITFNIDNKNFPAYLVDIIHDNDQKILVLMIRDYIKDLMNYTSENAAINTLDLKAYIVPASAIIERDDKTYIKILQKGYFTNEKEVNVRTYDGRNAILSAADNPDLSSGTSIRIHP